MTDPDVADLQALMFRCRVHPNSWYNGEYLRGYGLRRTHRGAPNPAYAELRRAFPALAARTYHGDTMRREYKAALHQAFRYELDTHTERCPNGTSDVVERLSDVGNALIAGEFSVGTERN